jgi:dihydroorotase/N-acyl-D-amino-acid deacylase
MGRAPVIAAAAVLGSLGLLAVAARRGGARAAAPEYDLVIANGRLLDGTGAPAVRADLGIRGDRVAAVGDLAAARAGRRLEASGLVVAPGFIDMLGQSEMELLVDGRAESKVRQGVTTEVTGEGESVAPVVPQQVAEMKPWLDKHGLKVDWTDFDGYFRRLEAARPALNLGTYVGAAQVRRAVLGAADVRPTPAQLARMEAEVDAAMRQGAFGLSSSLIYAPGVYARTDELVALARVAARHGGLYATHIRDEGEGIMAALEEAFTIGRQAGIRVEIWHLKVAGRRNWGRMGQVVEAIEAARAGGLDVAANVYPYTASANSLSSTLPAWVHEGGVDAMIARFHDPAQRERILREVREGADGNGGWKSRPPGDIMITSVLNPGLERWSGRRLTEVAQAMGTTPEEALLRLVEADRASTSVVRFSMNEDDLQAALRRPWVSVGADSGAAATDGPLARERRHPRAFGSMARVLGRYSRDLGLFPLEEAVRRMTSLPAQRVGLADRGLLKPGFMADVVVFDPARVRDRATYEQSAQYAEGVEHVVVNGRVVLEKGSMTGERPGRALRHVPAAPAPWGPGGEAAQRR